MRSYSIVAVVLCMASSALAGNIAPQPSTTAARCETTLVVPKPAKIICNAHGTLSSPMPRPGTPETVIDADDCRDLCLSDPKCASFGYLASDTSCRRLSKPILKQGWQKNAQQPEVFYNRRCFGEECNCAPESRLPDVCGEDCVNFSNDFNNCGSCGHQCATSQEVCFNGQCTAPGR